MRSRRSACHRAAAPADRQEEAGPNGSATALPLFREEAVAFRRTGGAVETAVPGTRRVKLAAGMLGAALVALGVWLVVWPVAPGLPLWRWLVGR